MPSSLIRGKYVICGIVDRNEATVIEDGAVFRPVSPPSRTCGSSRSASAHRVPVRIARWWR